MYYINILHRLFDGRADDLPLLLDGADGIQYVVLDCSPSIISSRRLDRTIPLVHVDDWMFVSTKRAVVDEGGRWSIYPLTYLLTLYSSSNFLALDHHRLFQLDS